MYTVKILDNKAFDALPYPETEISLGIADPVTQTAFVRRTVVPELNQYLIHHELEHLIEQEGGVHSDHYKHGVYYKQTGDMIQAAAPFLIDLIAPGAGTAIGTGLAVGNASSRKGPNRVQGGLQRFQSPQILQSAGGGGAGPQTPGAPGGGNIPGGGTSGALTGGQGTLSDRLKGFFAGRVR